MFEFIRLTAVNGIDILLSILVQASQASGLALSPLVDPTGTSYLQDMYFQYQAPLAQCDPQGSDLHMKQVRKQNDFAMGLTQRQFIDLRTRYINQISRSHSRPPENVKFQSNCLGTFANIERDFRSHIFTRSATLLRLFNDPDVRVEFPKYCGKFLNDRHCPSIPADVAPNSMESFRGLACLWREIHFDGKPLVAGKMSGTAETTIQEIAERSDLQNSPCARYLKMLDRSIFVRSLPGAAPVALTSASPGKLDLQNLASTPEKYEPDIRRKPASAAGMGSSPSAFKKVSLPGSATSRSSRFQNGPDHGINRRIGSHLKSSRVPLSDAPASPSKTFSGGSQ